MTNTLAPADLDSQMWGLENDVIRERELQTDRVKWGEKLIRIRALLEQKNGRMLSGKAGADGLHPNGWTAWCRNSGIDSKIANRAVRLACGLNYNGERMQGPRRFRHCVHMIISAWAIGTDADKLRLARFIHERYLAERTNP